MKYYYDYEFGIIFYVDGENIHSAFCPIHEDLLVCMERISITEENICDETTFLISEKKALLLGAYRSPKEYYDSLPKIGKK